MKENFVSSFNKNVVEPHQDQPSNNSQSFFQRSRLMTFFYSIRGLDLPGKIQQKPSWREFDFSDWAIILYFVGSNALRMATFCIIFEGILRSPYTGAGAFKEAYLVMAYAIIPLLVLMNAAAVWLKWGVQSQWIKFTSGTNCENFDAGQNRRFNAMIAALLGFFTYEIYYVIRSSYPGGPKWVSIILEVTYYELTYTADLTPLILYHMAQVFQNLEKELFLLVSRKCCSWTAEQRTEKLRILFREWVLAKRTVGRFSGAASCYWLPFMTWAIASISMKIFGLATDNGHLVPLKFWYDVLSIAVRAGIIVLVCSVGQATSDSGALLLKRMAELDPMEDPDLWREAQTMLATADAHDGVHVSLGNFCRMDRSIIPSILMVIVTYFIALVQMKSY